MCLSSLKQGNTTLFIGKNLSGKSAKDGLVFAAHGMEQRKEKKTAKYGLFLGLHGKVDGTRKLEA